MITSNIKETETMEDSVGWNDMGGQEETTQEGETKTHWSIGGS